MPKEEIVRRGLVRSEIPIYGAAGVAGRRGRTISPSSRILPGCGRRGSLRDECRQAGATIILYSALSSSNCFRRSARSLMSSSSSCSFRSLTSVIASRRSRRRARAPTVRALSAPQKYRSSVSPFRNKLELPNPRGDSNRRCHPCRCAFQVMQMHQLISAALVTDADVSVDFRARAPRLQPASGGWGDPAPVCRD